MKIFYCFFLLVFLSTDNCFSQDSSVYVFHLNKLPPEGVLLEKGWKFHAGDNTAWANPDINDNTWDAINPASDIYYLPQVRNAKICWLRLRLQLDSSLVGKPLALVINQIGASEIYLNEKLVKRFGQVSSDSKQLQTFNPKDEPVTFQFADGVQQVFAIRYAINPNMPYLKANFSPSGSNPCFLMRIQQPGKAMENYFISLFASISPWIFQFGIYLLLTIIHLFFFLYYRVRRVNFYFAIYTFAESITFLCGIAYVFSHEMIHQFIAQAVFIIAATVNNIFLVISVYKLLKHPTDIFLKSIITFCILCVPFMFWPYTWSGKSILFSFVISTLGTVRISILAIQRKQPGGIIVLFVQLISILSFIIFAITYNFNANFSLSVFIIAQILASLAFLSPPIFISILLAREFAQTNISLKQQLNQVEKLSQRTIEQEKEKQEILSTQNILLEKQVTERTAELKGSLEELKSTQAQLIQSEKMASLGELTAGIAHEIQNPLNFVNNFSEVNAELIDELKIEFLANNKEEVVAIANDIKENEQKILHHGKRADAIVKGMLQHSRVSTGQKELTDINVLADEYLRLSYHGLRAKDKTFNATLQTDFDATLEKINIVPQDIGRVLLNLYNNAFYAVNEKKKQAAKDLPGFQNPTGLNNYEPTVSVSTKKIGDKILISVKDNGNGIPQKVLDKIFQPFFTTKPTGEGTGLGLSLSYDIVKAHGGELKVETEEGAKFTITIPQ